MARPIPRGDSQNRPDWNRDAIRGRGGGECVFRSTRWWVSSRRARVTFYTGSAWRCPTLRRCLQLIMRFLPAIAGAASILLLDSCATLRLQTLTDKRLPSVRISIAGDDRSLAELMTDRKADLRLKKQSPGTIGTNSSTGGELIVPNGTKALILEETKRHCAGIGVFTRVRIADGPSKDAEGWVCGAFLTHRKGGAL